MSAKRLWRVVGWGEGQSLYDGDPCIRNVDIHVVADSVADLAKKLELVATMHAYKTAIVVTKIEEAGEVYCEEL